ncbi:MULTISPECIES: hypothetical protein [unclassified Paenibacillus]|uniref:hypothetical protein n=1 Tax=unclassified Paenibacillus TaxID=185978 RepID=UPI0027894229|nr:MULTISPECIES: hypothetical protein [unclassified Paenibacillus]MDQ0896287.1 hypothetical protein [Paenibacillus sp. V4I7]MDQ0913785.1 hypothetical protein [Paenibacillus sp. V4I5]
MDRKEVWEMTLEERLARLKKRIPKTVWMNHGVVESARLISIEDKERLINELQGLLNRLDAHTHYWEDVLVELKKPPILCVVNE